MSSPACGRMGWYARVQKSRTFHFLRGGATALVGCGVAYLVCDTVSDVITLRECQKLVLPLAVRNEQLASALQLPLTVGPTWSSSLRVSPTGSMVQCQFKLDGQQRSSDVSATVRRKPYATPFLYNLLGPGKWELIHCHVLLGARKCLFLLICYKCMLQNTVCRSGLARTLHATIA